MSPINEIPEYIARPSKEFSGLDDTCNIAEKKLNPEEGLYVLEKKSENNIENHIIAQRFEELFSIPENNKNCINMLNTCLLGKEV